MEKVQLLPEPPELSSAQDTLHNLAVAGMYTKGEVNPGGFGLHPGLTKLYNGQEQGQLADSFSCPHLNRTHCSIQKESRLLSHH